MQGNHPNVIIENIINIKLSEAKRSGTARHRCHFYIDRNEPCAFTFVAAR